MNIDSCKISNSVHHMCHPDPACAGEGSLEFLNINKTRDSSLASLVQNDVCVGLYIQQWEEFQLFGILG